MTTLDGKVAIVTGGGRGIGRSYALRMAAEGAKVVVNSVTAGDDGTPSTSSAHDVVREITAAGGQAVAHVGSVAEWSEGERLIATALEAFGRLDILVNNAGFVRDRQLVNMDESDWDAVIDVHLKGHFVPMRFAGAYWRDRSKAGEAVDAAIINTTAGAGLHGNFGQSNYASAKAGVAALTIVAAREMQRFGVRVNCVAPLARTRMMEAMPAMAATIAEPDDPAVFDVWSPDNLAPLVVYLASSGCPFTGQVFNMHAGTIGVWGGWTLDRRFEQDHQWTVAEIATALSGLDPGPPAFDPK